MHCSHNGGHPLNGELQRRLALVIANFRPKRIRGVAINALLLVAYREVGGHSTVKLLAPHAALLPGERVTVLHTAGTADDPFIDGATLDRVVSRLRVSGSGVVSHADVALASHRGPISAETLMGCCVRLSRT